MSLKRCKHFFRISFGPVWVCNKCGAIKNITAKEYEKINNPRHEKVRS